MSTPDEIVALELERLSANFVDQLPEQVRAVEHEVAAWLDAPCDTGRYQALTHRVHQLKGSGSTFGCPGVSRAARILERNIRAYRGDVDAGRRPAAAAIESALEQLQNEVNLSLSRDPKDEG